MVYSRFTTLFLLFLTSVFGAASLQAVPVRIDAVDPGLGYDPQNNSWTSVAVTPDGVPGIAYVTNSGTLKYARYNHPGWSIETIATGGGEYSHVSLSLDSAGNPVVACELFNAVFVYVKSGGSWSIDYYAYDNSGDVTVRHDPLDNLHVGFVQWPNGSVPTIMYATNKSGSWVEEVVDHYAAFPSSSNSYVAMDLNGSGQPGIAWRDEYGNLQYSWKVSTWITDQVSSLNAMHISLVVSEGAVPHIAFLNADDNDLMYSVGPVFNWSTTLLDPTGSTGFDTSIALDSNDLPHISYFDDETDKIDYKYLSGGVWYGQIIESSGRVGYSTSIALDAYDNVHFSYLDHSEEELHYAVSQDCNGNGEDDLDDVTNGILDDCDNNGIADSCEIGMAFADDCDGNGIPDACDTDCNNNNVPDACDISDGMSLDCNGNGIPDECEPDCNSNGIPDECDIDDETSPDCNRNDIPDECDFASGESLDCNGNGIPDECDIKYGGMPDCDKNGIPDECDFAAGGTADCNANFEIDLCEFPGALQLGGTISGWFGQSVVSADFNGDGLDDVAVGQPYWSGSRGRVHIYYGGDPMDTTADEVWGPANPTNIDYGWSLAAGNIDGDEYDDLVIGSPGYNLDDGVYFVFRGTAEADLTYWKAKGGVLFTDMRFGSSLALADINGDGKDDIIVGAPERATNNDPGHVFVYSGSSPDGNPIETWVADGNNDRFGYSVANAGDVDGNGLDDVIVGAEGSTTNGNMGYAKLFLSHVGGSVAGPVLATGMANDLFGHAVNGVGDFNDDGYDDFVVCAPRSGVPGDIPGRAFLYLGSATPDGGSDLTFTGAEHLANLGSAVSRAGDLNDDGFEDVIIGSDHLYNGTEFAWADIYFGGPHFDPIPDKRFTSEYRGYGLGMTVAPAGDTNGDGLDEVLIADPPYSIGGVQGLVSIVHLSLPDDGDCNGNGISDMCDISEGTSQDFNQNGLPDECGDVAAVDGPSPRRATRLLGAFPTPFNPRTELRFELARSEAVDLSVFDMSGRLVRVLARGEVLGAGRHAIPWQGRDGEGRQVASGVYYFRLVAGDYRHTMKMLLMK